MNDKDQSYGSAATVRVPRSLRALRIALIASCAVGIVEGVVPQALAQGQPAGATPVTSPVQTIPIPRSLPDQSQPPNAEELGMTVGSFRLYPTLDLRAGYDTNVFARPAGQETASAYEAIRPSLDLRS